LDRCLRSVKKHVDGIFLTITGDNAECERVAKKYKAEVSHFKWIDDFSAARNYNFSQVPESFTHILWLDADDVVSDAANLKLVAEKMEEKQIDGCLVWYMYAFDEVGNVTVQTAEFVVQ